MYAFISSPLELIKLVREASRDNKLHILTTLQLPPRIHCMLTTPNIRKGQTQLAALWGRRDGAQLPLFICLVESFQPLLLCSTQDLCLAVINRRDVGFLTLC